MKRMLAVGLLVAGLLGLLACGDGGQEGAAPAVTAESDQYLVYVGTYTRGGESKGIYAYRFDAVSGEVESLGLAAEVRDPSFLGLHPNGRFLYAVSEIDDYDEDNSGSVTAFEIDKATGKLSLLNVVSSKGAWPCDVEVDKTGQMLTVANYRGGSVAAFPVMEDGRLGEASVVKQNEGSSVNPQRQQQPHAHSVDFSQDNRFLISADLGTDQVLVFRADPEDASLEANDPAFAKVEPGAGPRHFAFHPSGNYAYVINELQSTVTAFSYDRQAGSFETLQTVSTLPAGFTGDNTTAEIEVHPSGEFLYGSNRGHDSIAVFRIEDSGMLRPAQHAPTQGERPRNFAVDPTAIYLFAANQNSGNIVLFRIDQQTGRLTPTGETLSVPSPVCVKFVKAG